KGGVKYIADSRLDNLKKIRMSGYDKELMLLRMPMKSEFEEVVDIADMSLNSELDTIKELSDIAKYRNKLHKIILMIDLGELREGILIKDLKDYVKQILELDGIEFLGIGTNLACFSGVLPTYKNMKELVDLKYELEDFFNIKIPIVSGVNPFIFTSCLPRANIALLIIPLLTNFGILPKASLPNLPLGIEGFSFNSII
ncbi:unnamed protein product, partial [marine sediment metagenome]